MEEVDVSQKVELPEEICKDDFLYKFHKKFELMKDRNKWQLSDGLYVEDQLYKFGIKCCYEQ